MFTSNDAPINEDHNKPLHIEALIHKHKVKCILIDGRSGLNLCTYKLIKQLGLSEDLVDTSGRITIKAYDDVERVSNGMITLHLQVGPITIETPCQVLDLDLPYNILLVRPWIHSLQVIPSTYHQCVKFPFNGREITIKGDPQPFQYCKLLEEKHPYHFPLNRPSPNPPSNTSNFASTSSQADPQIKILDNGCGEYKLDDVLLIGNLPLSPKSFGKPKELKKDQNSVIQCKDTTFQQWGPLDEESLNTDVSSWLYQEEDEDPAKIPKKCIQKHQL